MTRLALAEIRVEECTKPKCGGRLLQRHHKGCEGMWIKHFSNRKRTKRYQEYVKRYYEFRKEDVVVICEAHHNEIHKLYYEEIRRAIVQSGYLPMREWSWSMAEALMSHLRKVCDDWLKRKTAGVKRKRPINWSKKPVRRK